MTKPYNNPSLLRLGSALSLLFVVAAGCGDDEEAPAPTPTAATTGTTSGTPTSTTSGMGGTTGMGGSTTTTSTTSAGGSGGSPPTGASFTIDFSGTGYTAAAGSTVVFGVIDGFDNVLFSDSFAVPANGEFDEAFAVQTSYTEPSFGTELHFYVDTNGNGDCDAGVDEPWVVAFDWQTDGQTVPLTKDYSDADYDNRACLFPIEP